RILAVHGDLPCNLIVLLEGEEEIGSPHIAEFAEQHRARLNADLVITADGPLHISGLPIITFGVRGIRCSLKSVAERLRSLLRYLHRAGHIAADQSPHGWRRLNGYGLIWVISAGDDKAF